MAFPAILFDDKSFNLCLVAAIALALPNLLGLLPPLKKVKVGNSEVEFDKALDQFEKDVKKAEKAEKATPSTPPSVTGSGPPPLRKEYTDGFKEILTSRASNTEKILASAILAEAMLIETARDLGLLSDARKRTGAAIVALLHEHGFITSDERDGFAEFWQIRNAVVHGQNLQPPTDEQTARVLDLLWRLVRTLG